MHRYARWRAFFASYAIRVLSAITESSENGIEADMRSRIRINSILNIGEYSLKLSVLFDAFMD